jgi:MoaA/NifB/PqqE/SkfB family radical SAM enzyme
MPTNSVQTVMITTRCSAGCSHCPFSAQGLEKLSMPALTLKQILNPALLAVISGGEPFEHENAEEMLLSLTSYQGAFRIASGGFVPMKKFQEPLTMLRREAIGFQGISLGTDVLTARNNKAELKNVWAENVRFLKEIKVPYSITITLGAELSATLVKELFESGAQPDFFYVRHRAHASENLANWLQQFAEHFPRTQTMVDQIN